jgi:RNA polymerase sigma factor (sigma-70 family)
MAAVENARIVVAGRRVSEEAFLEALGNNDDEATRLIVRQLKGDVGEGGSHGLALVSRAYYCSVNQFLLRRLNDDQESASEAWNDTLMRIYTRIDKFDRHKSSFRTWVYNQAAYAALDRKRLLLRSRPAASTGEALDEPVSEHPRESTLSHRETRAVRRAFARLTETQRRLLWLTAIEGYRPSELATEGFVDLPAEHVRVYVNRAAAKLNAFYREELDI